MLSVFMFSICYLLCKKEVKFSQMDLKKPQSNNTHVKASSANRYKSPLNVPDKYGNTSLHRAVINKDLEFLERILSNENLQRNPFNDFGETPLTISLMLGRSPNIIKMLLMGGCDPNIPNMSRWYPLHIALDANSPTSAHELLKAGANVDVQNDEEWTPLHFAILNDNLEAVCMLLYYGADVSIADNQNTTAFDHAFSSNVDQIIYELIDYYDCFSNLAKSDFKHYAVCLPFVHRKVCIFCNNGELFKKMWLKADYRLLLECRAPSGASRGTLKARDATGQKASSANAIKKAMLVTYMTPETCVGWLECLYMILESDIAFKLVQSCNYLYIEKKFKLFETLLGTFSLLGIAKKDRVAIIEICVSLGAVVYLSDIYRGVELFGFDDEVEALIRVYDDPDESELLAQAALICFVNREPTPEEVFDYLKINNIQNKNGSLVQFLRFFALSVPLKEKLLHEHNYLEFYENQLRRYLELIPQVPSLIEVCRNKIRQCIKKTYKFKKTYQFHDAIKSLNLPPRLADILRFKTCLY